MQSPFCVWFTGGGPATKRTTAVTHSLFSNFNICFPPYQLRPSSKSTRVGSRGSSPMTFCITSVNR